MERFHSFGCGDGGVVAVDLEEVDIICAQTFEGCVYGFEDCAAGKTYGEKRLVQVLGVWMDDEPRRLM